MPRGSRLDANQQGSPSTGYNRTYVRMLVTTAGAVTPPPPPPPQQVYRPVAQASPLHSWPLGVLLGQRRAAARAGVAEAFVQSERQIIIDRFQRTTLWNTATVDMAHGERR